METEMSHADDAKRGAITAGPGSCPNCGGSAIVSSLVADTFTHGEGEDATEVTATVPLRTCKDCKFQYLDQEAEDLAHEALCEHLGVLTPRQIRTLRASHSMSRVEFARFTKLGEASLGRWERGTLIQNGANDQYLFLLGFPENAERLRNRAAPMPPATTDLRNCAVSSDRANR